jgi:hypothetical protein
MYHKHNNEEGIMEKKLKHLEFLQEIINRMANCSFLLKGWSVILVAALLALSAATQEKVALIAISFVPVIVFWLLDGYYLWQERLFRAVYNAVSEKIEDEIDFKMNPLDFVGGRNTWLSTIFSKTIVLFYLSLIITMTSVAVYLIYY